MVAINFACKKFPIDQVLKCSFDLSISELEILKILLKKRGECAINEIVDRVDKDRTTIQRSMQSLYKKDLINRHQINLDKGGYYFVYSSKSKDAIKQRIKDYFSNFESVVIKEIDGW